MKDDMNKHGYVLRVGGPGEDLWRCQATGCGDSGPLKELMGRECPHVMSQGEAETSLLDAIGGAP